MDILKTTLNAFIPPSRDIPVKESSRRALDRKTVPPSRSIVLSWSSPLRPFVPRTPVFYKRLWSLIIVVSLILVLAGLPLLAVVIFSLGVLYYVLTNVPPEKVKHEIDNYGLFYLGSQYYWDDFKFFFFTKDAGFDILNIDTKEPYPGRMMLILDGVSYDQIKDILSQNISMRETPPETMLEKVYKKVSSKLSLE
ncbi:MAG: hypothetical protein AAB443_01375 [Patescibacteria group bacterium]